MSVLGVHRQVDPSPRAMEGMAALRLYSTSKRDVRATPKKEPATLATSGLVTHQETSDAYRK